MIPFPKLHIAESVLNRINNTLEEVGPLGDGKAQPAPPSMLQTAPIPPNPLTTGLQVEDKLSEPAAPVGVEPGMETAVTDEMAATAVMGGSPFDGMLLGATR